MPDAITPYNFVPLPERIIPAEEHPWPEGGRRPYPQADRYHKDLNTGWFDLEITTLTPTYTRAAREIGAPAQDQPVEFFHYPDGRAVLPGTSLRGMVRSLFEVITCSRLEFVNDTYFFFGAFAEVKGPNMRDLYPQRFDKSALRGGVLARKGDRLVLRVSRATPQGFVVTRAEKLDRAWVNRKINEYPQPRRVSVDIASGATHRVLGVGIGDVVQQGGTAGWLIAPGVDVPRRGSTQRTWFQVILEPGDQDIDEYEVPDDVAQSYLQWGDMAPGSRFTEERQRQDREGPNRATSAPRRLGDGSPAFALVDAQRKTVTALGANMMMHLRYKASVVSVASRALASGAKQPQTDLTQAVFGRVRDLRPGAERDARTDQVRSRVFFEDAVGPDCRSARLDPNRTHQALLLGPKPTSFQVYLQQPSSYSLTHWDDQEASLAGRKFYWHRSNAAATEALDSTHADARDDLMASMQPLRAGVRFVGRVRFENLNDVELGALYAALQLPDGLAHKIGMGKALGLGSVRIETRVTLLDMRARLASMTPGAGLKAATQAEHVLVRAYSALVGRVVGTATTLWADDRMRALAAMLSWDGRPEDSQTEQVGFSDQWRYRWTLPSPVQLARPVLLADVCTVDPAAVEEFAPRGRKPGGKAQDEPPKAAKPAGPAYKVGDRLVCTVVAHKGAGVVEVELPNGERAGAAQMHGVQVGEVCKLKVLKVGGDAKVKELRR